MHLPNFFFFKFEQVQTATRQVMDRIPQFSNTSPTTFSTLYLQLTVDDMGICVPVESINNQVKIIEITWLPM